MGRTPYDGEVHLEVVMPIYEYRCTRCDHDFEELVRLGTQDTEVPCPSCGEHHARRKVSTFAVRGSSSPAPSSSGCGPSGFT